MLILSQMVLSSCGSGSDSDKKSEQVVSKDIAGYSKASCLYKYDEGPVPLAPLAKNVETTYFSKRIDMSLLAPVLKASAAGVVQFAEQNGVRYYKTASKNTDTCRMLNLLPEAPSDIQNDFKKSNESGNILGLYEGKNSIGLPSTKDVASITVLEDANKWVLVHEYVHHLFAVQLDNDGNYNPDLKSDLSNKLKTYSVANEVAKGANSSEKEVLINNAAMKLNDFVKTFMLLLKQYTLEEMTIETILANKLDSSELVLVEPKQRINGAAYIISSGKKATDLIASIKKEVTLFQLLNSTKLGITESNLLTDSSRQLDQITTDIDSLTSTANKFLLTQGISFKGFRAVSFSHDVSYEDPTSHVGCSHGEIPAEIILAIDNLQANHK